MSAAATWYVPAPTLSAMTWRAGWTTAAGPDFKSDPTGPEHAQAVAKLTAAAGLPQAAWVRQVHGGTVLRAAATGCVGEADALWTDHPGLGVVGRSADCPLILIGGEKTSGDRIWGFAHASWRSTVRHITGNLIAAMTAAGGDPASMRAVIGPSAGPCCYEVGPEVRREALDRLGDAAEWYFLERSGQLIFDLWAANRGQAEAAGVAPDNIHACGACTICGTLYPSHRREGKAAGRFAAIIGG